MKMKKGQTIVEYIIIIALIALVAFSVIKILGGHTKAGFEKAGQKVEEATKSDEGQRTGSR
jgi:Flp pilus assembly pilin Flp